MTVSVIERVIPTEAIVEALAANGKVTKRERKLNLTLTVLLLIGINLWGQLSIKNALHKLTKGLRLVWGNGNVAAPSDSALCYRRYQLGAEVMQTLFGTICQPIATEQTAGAFLFGFRLMALDGSTESVPDSEANRHAFGKVKNSQGEGGYPQVQTIYLAECGTHVIVDAGFWHCRINEKRVGKRLLRSVTANMLVTWDRGFHTFDMFATVRERESHVLARLPGSVKPKQHKRLADGSWLGWLQPSCPKRRKTGERLLVRIIEYRIKDAALANPNEVHRLVTTLLDPELYPAQDLVCVYHERWEIETIIDEIDTHQLSGRHALRSQKPVGVIQELYALLLAHFIIRYVMHEAAATQPDRLDTDRLSFTTSLELVKDAFCDYQLVAAQQRDRIYVRLLAQIVRYAKIPERRIRIHPRVVKRQASPYKKKRLQHNNWPQPKQAFSEAIVLI